MTFEEREFYDLNQELERTAGAEVISIDGDFGKELKKDLEEKICCLAGKTAFEWRGVYLFMMAVFLVAFALVGFWFNGFFFPAKEQANILSINVDAPVLPFEERVTLKPVNGLVGGLVSE